MLWTLAHQAPLPIRFSRQEFWSGLPCPPAGGLPIPGMEPASLTSLALVDRLFTTSATWEALDMSYQSPNTLGLLHVSSSLDLIHLYIFHIPLNNSAAAAAKSLQSCLTLCDPIDGSPPGSLSLGFSRQEHWSGLPFPSPMHESEK